jgi:hypothetical protein
VQLLDVEQALRALAEGQVGEYVGVLEKLARTPAPAEADTRKRGDLAYFKRLTAAGWLAFFAAAQGGQAPLVNAGWGVSADLGGQFQRPQAGRFAEAAWTLMQQRSKLFRLVGIEGAIDGVRHRGTGGQRRQPGAVEGIDGVEGRIGSTTQLSRNL